MEVVREQLSSARSRRVQAAGDEVGRVDLEITFLRRRAAALNEATKLLDKRTDEAVAAQRASEQAEEEQ